MLLLPVPMLIIPSMPVALAIRAEGNGILSIEWGGVGMFVFAIVLFVVPSESCRIKGSWHWGSHGPCMPGYLWARSSRDRPLTDFP